MGMTATALLPLLLPVLVFGILFLRRRLHARAVARQMNTPLSEQDRAILLREVPLIGRLPQDLRAALEGRVQRFLAQVEFQGCNGLTVTRDMELSIAAQASLLVVNSDQWYDGLTTVMIYPAAFKSVQRRRSGYVVTEKEIVRQGESWIHGPVILSWRDAEQGALNDHDGKNVVLHEFAHQIDALSGATNGVPLLAPDQSFAEWEAAFLAGFSKHAARVMSGRKTAIDPYGAENHAEFFAVAVELFFERPLDLRRDAPAVYEQISRLFRLDPARWSAATG